MDDSVASRTTKAATAARMYDYYLGGIHNFPADQAAARTIIEHFPFIQAVARANRAFVVRSVRELAKAGVKQYLDIGAGIPTVDNVHSIVQDLHDDAKVVYVDIDPVAVAEGLEMLEGNPRATSVRGDVREPEAILAHPEVRRMLDFGQPIALLLAAVLHFVADHEQADAVAAALIAALPAGSYVVVSHTATESFRLTDEERAVTEDVYQRRTSTPGTVRTRAEVERLFAGLELLPPGVVSARDWHPDPDAPADETGLPGGGIWVGVAKKD